MKNIIKIVVAMLIVPGLSLADQISETRAETLTNELTAWNIANPYRYETFWLSVDSNPKMCFGIYRYQQGTSTKNIVEASSSDTENFTKINWYTLYDKEKQDELIIYNNNNKGYLTVNPKNTVIGGFIPPFGLQDVYSLHKEKTSNVIFVDDNHIEISYTEAAQQEGFPAWTHYTLEDNISGGGKTLSKVKFPVNNQIFEIRRQLHLVGQENVLLALPDLSSFSVTNQETSVFLTNTLQ